MNRMLNIKNKSNVDHLSLKEFTQIFLNNPRNTQPYIIYFDTETTGLGKFGTLPSRVHTRIENSQINQYFDHVIQLGIHIDDLYRNTIYSKSVIINPGDNIEVSEGSLKVHGITRERVTKEGISPMEVYPYLKDLFKYASKIIGHNVSFDRGIVYAEFRRINLNEDLYGSDYNKKFFCTMQNYNIKKWVFICINKGSHIQLRSKKNTLLKLPSLNELYFKCFGTLFNSAHDALVDTLATRKCYYYLKDNHII
jgi:DNA polymerase III epsilon subunit-like protein